MTYSTADEAVVAAHRASYGRLVGWLVRRTGDVQLAEDAVASAFAGALETWRSRGVPESTEAWLRVAARNAAVSALRRSAHTTNLDPESADQVFATEHDHRDEAIDDERLRLMLLCAHPAIDERVHAPLMLQVVLGIDAARIASVFLVPPSTMGQRLSRAKAKISAAGLRLRELEADELPARLDAVLRAIYAAYGLANPLHEEQTVDDDEMRAESIRLAETIVDLGGARHAEALGLLALLLLTESRRGARIVDGRFVPLTEHDVARWNAELRRRGDDTLRLAAALAAPGRFQLEAAISAVHSGRGDSGMTEWSSIIALYRGLLELHPSIGAAIGAAAALLEIGDVEQAQRMLDDLPAEAVGAHQPYWVCRARLAITQGDDAGRHAAAERAIGLTRHPAVRRHLIETIGP